MHGHGELFCPVTPGRFRAEREWVKFTVPVTEIRQPLSVKKARSEAINFKIYRKYALRIFCFRGILIYEQRLAVKIRAFCITRNVPDINIESGISASSLPAMPSRVIVTSHAFAATRLLGMRSGTTVKHEIYQTPSSPQKTTTAVVRVPALSACRSPSLPI